MPANKLAALPKVRLTTPVAIAIVAAIVAAGGALYLTLGPAPAAPPAPVLTQEAKDYLANLKLSDVGIQATDSFAKQSLVEITGKVANLGAKRVKLAEVTCVFRNASGQTIKRDRAFVVSPKAAGLAPGETKTFRLAFDTIPQDWNQGMPDLVIAQIVFE